MNFLIQLNISFSDDDNLDKVTEVIQQIWSLWTLYVHAIADVHTAIIIHTIRILIYIVWLCIDKHINCQQVLPEFKTFKKSNNKLSGKGKNSNKKSSSLSSPEKSSNKSSQENSGNNKPSSVLGVMCYNSNALCNNITLMGNELI